LFDPETLEFLNLDIYAELSRNGIQFFNEEDIFNTLGEYDSIPTISPEKEFISYLSKKLDKDDLSEESFLHLTHLYNKEPLCKKELSNYFPRYQVLLNEAFSNNGFTTVVSNRKYLINELNRLKSFKIRRFIYNNFRIIKRIVKPTGMSVSFLGPDGSGKSTIIDNILNTRLPFRRKDYFHLKPIRLKKADQKVQSDPHQYPAYSSLKSYVKILYFVFQYNMGWIRNIIPLKIRSSLVIFDRYFDDLLADQKRYRYGGGFWFLKFARVFIPKPNLYFILYAKPDVIYGRKKEVAMAEVDTQISRYEALVDNKVLYKIDVDRTPAETTDEVITILMNKLSERYLKYSNK